MSEFKITTFESTDSANNGGDERLVYNESLNQLLERTTVGSLDKAIGNNLYGINNKQTGNMVPMNKDNHGYTFFTRPQLNLTAQNISQYRGFYNLLSLNKYSLQRFVRTTLDPRTMTGTDSNRVTGRLLESPFVDSNQAFIPILTNNLKSLSGFPDYQVPEHTSPNGHYMEQHSMVDGVLNKYESYDVTATFRNTQGDPISYLFYIWTVYQTLVYEGTLSPWFDFLIENVIDYNTRIYRLVLDSNRRYVTKIACTGASFPLSVPLAQMFDFNSESPLNLQSSDISIRFKCNGFIAYEDIVKHWFNRTVGIFNPSMNVLLGKNVIDEPGKLVHIDGLTKIPYEVKALIDDNKIPGMSSFNHRAYPWINYLTSELEWWIPTELIDENYEGI